MFCPTTPCMRQESRLQTKPAMILFHVGGQARMGRPPIATLTRLRLPGSGRRALLPCLKPRPGPRLVCREGGLTHRIHGRSASPCRFRTFDQEMLKEELPVFVAGMKMMARRAARHCRRWGIAPRPGNLRDRPCRQSRLHRKFLSRMPVMCTSARFQVPKRRSRFPSVQPIAESRPPWPRSIAPSSSGPRFAA